VQNDSGPLFSQLEEEESFDRGTKGAQPSIARTGYRMPNQMGIQAAQDWKGAGAAEGSGSGSLDCQEPQALDTFNKVCIWYLNAVTELAHLAGFQKWNKVLKQNEVNEAKSLRDNFSSLTFLLD